MERLSTTVLRSEERDDVSERILCAVCHLPIYNRATPSSARPWLHVHGMAYEEDGHHAHDAAPVDAKEPPTLTGGGLPVG
jgi:hypothetical protein